MPSEIEQYKSTNAATVLTKEMRELRRVYNQLCFFAEKRPRMERIDAIDKQLSEVRLANQDSSLDPTSLIDKGDSSKKRLEQERHALHEEMKEIQARPEQVIRPQDTGIAMKALGKRQTKKEIHDMMWEVDEKIDGVIDWEEFKLMFERNIKDTSGLEPAGFYHMVQFMIYDHDCNGMVSIDETMNMLYARLGRARMETTITKLFGGEDGAPIKEVGQQGGEINFDRYWDVVVKEQRKMFDESELGRNLAEKKSKKKSDSRIHSGPKTLNK
mmetsp:Transcript_1276/g.1823  ORF Transcript_1276/g.1823 Transcript_1276/m.1823 type:complete len:271 (-) Transcript_1276:277-1089(-)|eukprot:CAMPEP_0184864890 /NCGR_PEP_ID=MMETSP0580-20130426/16234_1 /TAXON_ID=1118495 /ORGANISM="Dactyliosolen fragilissimus" /LENGTH=270 /DNA_ID=CAMNT_0027363829 /DNA_START=206 /DNA_END=1018 /DNA_ORIENTATION=+